MKKHILFSFLLLTSSCLFSQSNLTIGPGETRIITKSEMNLIVKEFRMGDNSTIVFEDGVKSWQLQAEKAFFGANTKINAKGMFGKDGVKGVDNDKDTNGECHEGIVGGNASQPDNGNNGVNLNLSFTIYQLGSCIIDASGGNGGNAKIGGKGGKGGRASCGQGCKGGSGGVGGIGGNGGNGGNAGLIKIKYSFANTMDSTNLDGLKLISLGGKLGNNGDGGPGGPGGDGKSCGAYKRGGGRAGYKGAFGIDGKPGLDSTPIIVKINL